MDGKSLISDLVCECDVGVLASLNLESLPSQKVLALDPKDPVAILPLVEVIKGLLAVEPNVPVLVISP